MTTPNVTQPAPRLINETVNRFKNARSSKKVKFLDQDVEIVKLRVADVLNIQAEAQELEKNPTEQGNLNLLINTIKAGCPELQQLSNDDFLDFAMDDLNKFSNEIMVYSGLITGKK